MLMALNRPDQFQAHLRAALKNGVSRAEVEEILLHGMTYCGLPAAVEGYKLAQPIFGDSEGAK
jgi:4-carboxymuconolactone decarboxylase